MPDLVTIDFESAWGFVKKLLLCERESFSSFLAFEKRLLSGKFLVLKNNFHIHLLAYPSRRRPKVILPFFESKSARFGHSLGYGYFAKDFGDTVGLADATRSFFGGLSGEIVAPLNGHLNLGFSLPALDMGEGLHSFLTAAPDPTFSRFLQGSWRKKRRYLAYKTEVSAGLREQVSKSLSALPSDFKIRSISQVFFNRDLAVFNRLVNQVMRQHPHFVALEDDEFVDVMKSLRPIVKPGYFQFLERSSRPIAFCFAIPDYQSCLRPGADWKNLIRMLRQRNSCPRARIIYSGILPEYRGRGLFKTLRASVIQNMIGDGVQSIESSYIDEDNAASIANVCSTGGKFSHEFVLYARP